MVTDWCIVCIIIIIIVLSRRDCGHIPTPVLSSLHGGSSVALHIACWGSSHCHYSDYCHHKHNHKQVRYTVLNIIHATFTLGVGIGGLLATIDTTLIATWMWMTTEMHNVRDMADVSV